MAKQFKVGIQVDGDIESTEDIFVTGSTGDIKVKGASAPYDLSLKDQEILYWMGY